jgi:DNA-binding NarL/FixJ family response regulator
MNDRQATTQTEIPELESLTRRELDVLRLLASGLRDREIAARLFLSVRTVNSHLRSIYSKLGVPSRSAATSYFLQRLRAASQGSTSSRGRG